jgi:hypothetical protein
MGSLENSAFGRGDVLEENFFQGDSERVFSYVLSIKLDLGLKKKFYFYGPSFEEVDEIAARFKRRYIFVKKD